MVGRGRNRGTGRFRHAAAYCRRRENGYWTLVQRRDAVRAAEGWRADVNGHVAVFSARLVNCYFLYERRLGQSVWIRRPGPSKRTRRQRDRNRGGGAAASRRPQCRRPGGRGRGRGAVSTSATTENSASGRASSTASTNFRSSRFAPFLLRGPAPTAGRPASRRARGSLSRP